jgi:acyl-CoA synthetase (AMP-forming)/AMP-acid ligase II
VPDGEIGDLYVKGPSAALMYWCNREKSRATFLGEWLRSGDKYCRLPNGCGEPSISTVPNSISCCKSVDQAAAKRFFERVACRIAVVIPSRHRQSPSNAT